jgi:hypothetical protein
MEVLMRVRLAVLAALLLACAPVASAQLTVRPQLQYHSILGTWNVNSALLGTLTINQNANGTLRGRYVSPVLQNDAACRGDYRAPGFVLHCQEVGEQPIIFSGAAAPITLTQQGAPPTQPRLRGYQYVDPLSQPLATAPMQGFTFTATQS